MRRVKRNGCGVGIQFLFSLTRRFSGISLGKVQPRFLPPHLPQHIRIRACGRPRLRRTDMLSQTHRSQYFGTNDAQSQRWLLIQGLLTQPSTNKTISPSYVPWPYHIATIVDLRLNLSNLETNRDSSGQNSSGRDSSDLQHKIWLLS